MKRFLSFFYTDWHWKLLSLGLAFLLLIIGTHMNNPKRNDWFSVRLEPQNIEILMYEELVLVNPEVLDIDVRVGVRGYRDAMEYLNAAGRLADFIMPSVDFRAVNINDVLDNDGPITVRLDISVNLYPGYEHLSIRPSFVEVEIDAVIRQPFPVSYEIVGDVDSGVELRPIRLANRNVTVIGSRTNVAMIDTIQVQVDVRGISYDNDIEGLNLYVLDAHENDITDLFNLSVSETTAFVSVWPIETMEIRVEGTGDVAAGFVVDGYMGSEPETVDIVRAPGRVQNYDYILVEVDLTGKNASFIGNVDIREWLPDGIVLRDGENPIIAVAVEIEPVERRIFNVPMDNVRTRGILVDYSLVDEMAFIRIEVYGPRTMLEELTNADIGLELDLRNLNIGTHFVTLTVDLPEGIELVQRAPALQVEITEPAVTDSDDYEEEVWELPPPVAPEDNPDEYDTDENNPEEDIPEDNNPDEYTYGLYDNEDEYYPISYYYDYYDETPDNEEIYD